MSIFSRIMLFALLLRQVAVVTLIVTNFKLYFNCYANFWKSYLKTCSAIVLFFNVFDHENMWTYPIFPFNEIAKSLCLFQQLYHSTPLFLYDYFQIPSFRKQSENKYRTFQPLLGTQNQFVSVYYFIVSFPNNRTNFLIIISFYQSSKINCFVFVKIKSIFF